MEDKKLNQDKESFAHKTGDKIERFGEKVSETSPKVGKVIYDAGNKIEHMGENKTK